MEGENKSSVEAFFVGFKFAVSYEVGFSREGFRKFVAVVVVVVVVFHVLPWFIVQVFVLCCLSCCALYSW